MVKRVGLVLTVVVVTALLAGCCTALVGRRLQQGAAPRVVGKIIEGVAKGETKEAAAEEQESEGGGDEDTAKPEATEGPTPVPPKAAGSVGGCFGDFPQYPGLKPDEEAKSMARILGAGKTFDDTRGYRSADSVAKVIAFYQERPAEAGWEPAPIQGVQGSGATLWWAKDKTAVLVFTVEDKQKTVVVLACGAEE